MSETDPGEISKLMTTPEVGLRFGVVCSTVAVWADRNLIPHTRTPSGRLRFYPDDIERLIRGDQFDQNGRH